MDLCARGPISKPLRPKAGGEHPISRIFVTVSRPAPRALAVQRPGSAAHPPPDIAADEAPRPSPSALPPTPLLQPSPSYAGIPPHLLLRRRLRRPGTRCSLENTSCSPARRLRRATGLAVRSYRLRTP